MNSEKTARFLTIISELCVSGSLINLTFSKFPKGEVLKVKARIVNISDAFAIRFEYFLTEGRVRHKNTPPERVSEEIEEILKLSPRQADYSGASCSGVLLVSRKGAVTLVEKNRGGGEAPRITGNNREKNYIFDGSEDFLIYLGISDKNGRVHDKKQAKFRQINRFCEQIRDIMKYLPREGAVSIADLCCGKSYLSFAVYFYLTVTFGRRVSMVCIDLKQSVIDYCADTAKKLSFDGMSFYCMDINDYKPSGETHLVISLHACDSATDLVLDFAVSARARVILSTPCCQHELSELFDCGELDFIGRYPLLKQKFCATATDALRLERLEAAGYKTDAIEFVDPEDTPKNTLLRGILKNRQGISLAERDAAFASYAGHYKFLTGREAVPLPDYLYENDEKQKF